MELRKIKKHTPLLIAALAILGIVLFSSIDLCIFRRVTGLPCPSCGITRAYIYLFTGDIRGAFWMHPLFPIVPVIAVLFLVSRRTKKNFTKIYITIGILFLVVYILRMIFLFPHTPPFDYNYDSILGKLLFR